MAGAAIAQLGEHQTENVKVHGSIPGRDISHSATDRRHHDHTQQLLVRAPSAKHPRQEGAAYTAQAAWSSRMFLASGASGLERQVGAFLSLFRMFMLLNKSICYQQGYSDHVAVALVS